MSISLTSVITKKIDCPTTQWTNCGTFKNMTVKNEWISTISTQNDK